MKPTHTPTPYELVKNGNNFYLNGPAGHTSGIAKIYDEDDAHFIHRACNSHNALLHTLKNNQNILVDFHEKCDGEGLLYCKCRIAKQWRSNEEAITLAEKGGEL